jgi:hypothetical protein
MTTDLAASFSSRCKLAAARAILRGGATTDSSAKRYLASGNARATPMKPSKELP